MDVTLVDLASSRVPNGVALGLVILALVVALITRSKFGHMYTLSVVLLASAIGGKWLSYNMIMAAPGDENSIPALQTFAGSVLCVAIVEALVAIGLIILAFGTSPKLLWVTVVAAFATLYAALCMAGWFITYKNADGKSPVSYEPWLPSIHWVFWALIGSTVVVALFTTLRGSQPKKA